MVHISRLRDKIEQYMEGNKIIHTVWGVGYKINKRLYKMVLSSVMDIIYAILLTAVTSL